MQKNSDIKQPELHPSIGSGQHPPNPTAEFSQGLLGGRAGLPDAHGDQHGQQNLYYHCGVLITQTELAPP